MAYVLMQPLAMAAAAAEMAGIGAAIDEATARAAGSITGVALVAADAVSAAAAALCNSYARNYQAVIRQARTFSSEFAHMLAAAGSAYGDTEIGDPIAADTALVTTGAFVEFLVLFGAADSIVVG